MRLAALFGATILLAAHLSRPVHAQIIGASADYDKSLKIYAIGIVKTQIFERWTGYGIYLGHGVVITAAHVVGRFPFLTYPRVLVGDQEFPATVIKKGSLEGTDLALLSVDEASLPMSLALRQNRICGDPFNVGQDVVVVDLNGVARSRIVSPRVVPAQYRMKYGTVIAELPVIGQSGSGIFHPEKKCLMGIITRAIRRYQFEQVNVRRVIKPFNVAKYFIPASTIADFIPPELSFLIPAKTSR